jgi:hypothetical protein
VIFSRFSVFLTLGCSTVKPVSSLLGDQSPLYLSSPLEPEHCPSESTGSNLDATNDHTATIRDTSAIPDPGNTEHLSDTEEQLNNLQEVDAAAHKTAVCESDELPIGTVRVSFICRGWQSMRFVRAVSMAQNSTRKLDYVNCQVRLFLSGHIRKKGIICSGRIPKREVIKNESVHFPFD